jgi:antitoxin component YwqK of YwqJK toxin-antitoxin module
MDFLENIIFNLSLEDFINFKGVFPFVKGSFVILQTPNDENILEVQNSKEIYRIRYHKNGKRFTEHGLNSGKVDGDFWVWAPNGNLTEHGFYTNGKFNGIFTTYYESNGSKRSEGLYRNDDRTGIWTFWHENGQKSSEGEFRNSSMFGTWTYWFANGDLDRRINWT